MNVTSPGTFPCCYLPINTRIARSLYVKMPEPLESVWNSARWRWWRSLIASCDYSYCGNCSQADAFVTEDELREYYPEIADEVMRYRNGDHDCLKFPHTLVLSFDHLCNLRCVTCRPSDADITRPVLEPLAESVEKCIGKVKRVVIAGDGEVAVSPHYRKLLGLVGGDTKITLMSNGTLLNMDFWASLGEDTLHRIDRVHISCDGTCKDVYERVRLRGSFDKWMENMAVLMNLKKQYGWTTKMMYTVSKVNYDDYRNADVFAKRVGFDQLHIGIAVPWPRPVGKEKWTTDQILGDHEKKVATIVATHMMKNYHLA